MTHSLHKRERLSNQKDIKTLFSKGKAFFVGPIQVIYCTEIKSPFSCKVLFIAPKKKFSKAVHRNRIKRICREAYRLEKEGLHSILNNKKQYQIALLYQKHEEKKVKDIKMYLHKAFNKIAEHG